MLNTSHWPTGPVINIYRQTEYYVSVLKKKIKQLMDLFEHYIVIGQLRAEIINLRDTWQITTIFYFQVQ